MKKLIAIMTIAAVLSSSALFARDATVNNKKVMDAFNKEFVGASDVSWYSTADKYVAKFTIKSSKVTAHFDREGNLLATSRYITDSELPLNVITRLMKKFPDQKIHNVVEYEAEGATTYVITLESETHWTVLKAASSGGLSTLKKLRKA